MREQRRSRRSILTIGAGGIASLAGCISNPFGSSGPQELTFEITLQERGDEITATIDPAGDVEGVIQANVNDDVTFDFVNDRDHPTGVHNHATDEEVVVEPEKTHTMTFTPTEEMVGRHEVEAFDAETAEGDDHHEENTTETEHHGETTTEGDHEETASEDDHEEGGHEGQEEFVIFVLEVRPQGD